MTTVLLIVVGYVVLLAVVLAVMRAAAAGDEMLGEEPTRAPEPMQGPDLKAPRMRTGRFRRQPKEAEAEQRVAS